MAQALGTHERSERVRGFVTSTAYFHTTKHSNKQSEEIEKVSHENEKFCLRGQELESINISTQTTPTSAHGSCSKPTSKYETIQCQKILKMRK